MELTPEQEKYLIQVRGPHDLFQFIIRDLAFATNITNAAVLFDDDFGELIVDVVLLCRDVLFEYHQAVVSFC